MSLYVVHVQFSVLNLRTKISDLCLLLSCVLLKKGEMQCSYSIENSENSTSIQILLFALTA